MCVRLTHITYYNRMNSRVNTVLALLLYVRVAYTREPNPFSSEILCLVFLWAFAWGVWARVTWDGELTRQLIWAGDKIKSKAIMQERELSDEHSPHDETQLALPAKQQEDRKN